MCNDVNTPYEYFEDTLGVQGRFLFSGDGAHPKSLQLISERGLRKKIDSGHITRLRNRAPGQPMLIKWDSLPIGWRLLLTSAFGDAPEQVKRTLFEQYYQRDGEAFRAFSEYIFADGSSLDDDEVEEYTLNASVLNTIEEIYYKRRSNRKLLKGKTTTAWEATCIEANRFRSVKNRNHTLPTHWKNIREVYNKYKKEGYLSLIDGRRKNQNARKVTPEIEIFLDNLFAEFIHKPNKYEVARQYQGFLDGHIQVINNETGEIYTADAFPQLSLSTVTAYVSKWHNAIATERLRSGDRQKYMAKFKPYHSLEQPHFAGSIISIDDRQPPFKSESGERIWFYNGIDLGSEAFVCWVYGKTKEGIILDFYRQLVRNFAEWGLNIPAELEAELSLNASFTDTFLKEGNMFQYVRIEPNNARGKRIERYYGNLRYDYEKRREGWLARPFALRESNQAGPKNVPEIPYKTIVDNCLRDIETWNNTEHSKIAGKTRWEVFLETQHPKIRPTNWRGIIPYLGHETKTSCNAGIIRLNGGEMLLGTGGSIATGTNLINLMKIVEGRDVTVKWLDGNDGRVLKAFVYVGGEYACEAISKPIYNRARIERTAEDEANYQAMSSYVATIEAYARRRSGEVDRVTVIDNRPRTLNTTFRIAGVSHYQPSTETALALPDFNEFETPLQADINTARPARASLRDRF